MEHRSGDLGRRCSAATLGCVCGHPGAGRIASRCGCPGAARPPCDACITIRVGLPHVVRGPSAAIADNRFTELALPQGGFRGFDAHAETRAIDGRTPDDMGAPGLVVLGPGKPGTYDSCGQWLNHVEQHGIATLGFVHAETACRYQTGQTHKSMALARSSDYGRTWSGLGQIITGTDAPTTDRNTGEGDCTVVEGQDSFVYAYCFRARDGGLIVARAPASNPAPGAWTKFWRGQWESPGLGGDATRLMNGSGVSAARWTTTGQSVLTGWVRGGLGLFLTRDHTTLTALLEPLLTVDPGEWRRPAPSELISYPVILDAHTGSNQLSNSWMLVYAYVPPNEGGDHKYLVFRDVDVSVSRSPSTPQVGVLLARWYDESLHDHWSTTAAVPGGKYRLESRSGYLMTAAPAGQSSVALEDCVSDRPGHPDHLVAPIGFCTAHAYQRLRTLGWVFVEQRSDTQPLFQCYSEQERSHFASNKPDCEGLGRAEALLGYDLIR